MSRSCGSRDKRLMLGETNEVLILIIRRRWEDSAVRSRGTSFRISKRASIGGTSCIGASDEAAL